MQVHCKPHVSPQGASDSSIQEASCQGVGSALKRSPGLYGGGSGFLRQGKAGTDTVKISSSVDVYGAEAKFEGHKRQYLNGITR